MAYVYWVHLPNHTINEGYVGVTTKTNVEHRWNQHKKSAVNNTGFVFHKAINKYGETLVYEVLFTGNYEGCLQLEEYFRPKPNIGWNINKGGDNGRYGTTHSKATKQYIGQLSSLRMRKEKNIMFNKQHTEETKAKISKANSGKTHTEEAKQKMSEANKGKILSKEHREKIGNAHKGKVVSDITKAKLSKAKVGKTTKPINVYCYKTNKLIAANTYAKQFAAEHNLSDSTLIATAKGRRNQHKGYYAKYVKEI